MTITGASTAQIVSSQRPGDDQEQEADADADRGEDAGAQQRAEDRRDGAEELADAAVERAVLNVADGLDDHPLVPDGTEHREDERREARRRALPLAATMPPSSAIGRKTISAPVISTRQCWL